MGFLKGIGGAASAILVILGMLVIFYVATTFIGVLANVGWLVPLGGAVVVAATLAYLMRRRSRVTTAEAASDVPRR